MIYYWNNVIQINRIEYKNKKIPKGFDGLKIVHLSDLHDKSFGTKQEVIINKIRKEKPDIIVVTGDMLDNYSNKSAIILLKYCVKIAPTYFVEGNHEYKNESKYLFYRDIIKLGVKVLNNNTLTLFRKGSRIKLSGYKVDSYKGKPNDFDKIRTKLNKLHIDKKEFHMFLIHRPDFLNQLSEYNIDLIFCGHAHGGQWRLFNKGLYCPDQGLFPSYTSGIHTKNKTSEIISRGLGNQIIYPRICNRPEIIVCTLKQDIN
jgi:predicted MPP superfamily phosphohydrolase